MTSHEQFEAWWKTQRAVCQFAREGSKNGAYHSKPCQSAWEAWQASREAVEVELPEPHAHVIWVQTGNAPDDYWDDVEISRSEQDKCCDGSDRYPVYARHEVVSMLDSAGIKVKGE